MPPAAPPVRSPPRQIPGFPSTVKRRAVVGEDLINPPYAIANYWPYGLSDRTAATNVSTLQDFGPIYNLYFLPP